MIKNINPKNPLQNRRYSTPENQYKMMKNKSTNDINNGYFNNDIIQNKTIKEIKEDDNKNNDTEYNQSKAYENIIQKPKIMKRNNESLILQKNMYNNINNKLSFSVRRGKIKLPTINIKK